MGTIVVVRWNLMGKKQAKIRILTYRRMVNFYAKIGSFSSGLRMSRLVKIFNMFALNFGGPAQRKRWIVDTARRLFVAHPLP